MPVLPTEVKRLRVKEKKITKIIKEYSGKVKPLHGELEKIQKKEKKLLK